MYVTFLTFTKIAYILCESAMACTGLKAHNVKGRGSHSPALKPGIKHIFLWTFGWLKKIDQVILPFEIQLIFRVPIFWHYNGKTEEAGTLEKSWI